MKEGWEEKTVKEFVNEGLIFKPLDGNHGEIHPLKNDYVDNGVPFIMWMNKIANLLVRNRHVD
jgi:type I restriction enzyme S subunit